MIRVIYFTPIFTFEFQQKERKSLGLECAKMRRYF